MIHKQKKSHVAIQKLSVNKKKAIQKLSCNNMYKHHTHRCSIKQNLKTNIKFSLYPGHARSAFPHRSLPSS